MNITPTSIKYANTLKTIIAVYDIDLKKPVLLFKSINFCINYLFGHRLLKYTDHSKYRYIIQKCCKKKQRSEYLNVFSSNLTYRYANDSQKEELKNNDFLILDENYTNSDFLHKINMPKNINYNTNNIEDQLQVGDFVEITSSKYRGLITRVKEIKLAHKMFLPLRYIYVLHIDRKDIQFKASVLKIPNFKE